MAAPPAGRLHSLTMGQGPEQSQGMSGGASGPANDDPETSRGDPAMIGRTVSGKYRIEKLLGRGAMGAVYRARFAALEKNVAVKVMHRSIAVDPKFVGRFHREAKAASRLDHPNSMRVIDFGEEPDGLLYIAMEYVEGRDLYRVILEDWPLSNADIADILMQALAALAVAHEMGVIHRDLKPENLMILRAKNDEERDAYLVKVCDFGIAKIAEKDDEPKADGGPGGQKLTTQGLVVGTPEYMSPEQARGEKLDARSDIYSMGIILYQLLTGRTPFAADTALAVVLKHITEVPAAPSVHYAGVHKGLEAVAIKALAKDRNERFQSARAMRNAIREALDGRPMPVDVAAATLAAPAGALAGTYPLALAGEVSSSHLTPLGTAAASAVAKRSRAFGVIPFGVTAALLATGVVIARQWLVDPDPRPRNSDRSSTQPSGPAPPAVPPEASSTLSQAPTSATSAMPPPDSKTSTHTAPTPTGRGAVKVAAEPPPTVAVAVASAPAPAPAPVPEPAPSPAVAAAPPPGTPAAPAAPAFNPQTCRATAGEVRSTGATNRKDLTMTGTAGAWTACAQRSIHEKPAAPIRGTVHLSFSDNGAFRGASCAECPPSLAQCIGSTTQRTVALKIRGGDVTGEPAFDVPLTVACE